MSTKSVESKRILMTGCSTGFGVDIRKNLLNQGHSVFGVGLGGPDLAIDFSLRHNLTSNYVHNIFAEATDKLGGQPEILINNAGSTHIAPITECGPHDYEDVWRVNFLSAAMFCKEFVRRWTTVHANQQKKIINTCSMATVLGLRNSLPYVCSKAALTELTKSLAKELAGWSNITVLGIAPATVDNTVMYDYAIERTMEIKGITRQEAVEYCQKSPLGRNVSRDELWAVYDFAVNQAPHYMTGEVIYMKGGMGV